MTNWIRKLWALLGRPNGAALAFIVAGAGWFVVGTLYGLASAIHLYAPEAFQNIPWLVFSRVRPAHVNTVLYGFVTTMLIGCGLYYVPVLLRRPLWSERLAWGGWALWNVVILSGPIGFAFAYSQGREYAEYEWIFDVLVELVLLAILEIGRAHV